ncbi:hypothetical protein G6F26_010776 [Rhizopus arrhizus]|nr:hypothetical protein G6F26_010776 [Rhizopus arrhizus]KAG1090021.1 hypothetical protein G6F39_010745 [Rhizopus arrhizus]KAG1373858.1 hypothetical protein G6F61_009826 [Rhizopus arrhizus]
MPFDLLLPSQIQWFQCIHLNWHDPINADPEHNKTPTFRNISTIDFLLIAADLTDMVDSHDIIYVARCNHAGISTHLTLGCTRTGLGIWCCNPYVAQGLHFRAEFTAFCTDAEYFLSNLDTPSLWILCKSRLKSFIHTFSKKATARHRRNLNKLQRMRKQLLYEPTDDETNVQLAAVESQLEFQYEHSSSVLVLRSGLQWRENERDRMPFLLMPTSMQQQQSISSIRTDTGILYSPDPIDRQAVADLLVHVPDSASISPDIHDSLLIHWTVDEISATNEHPPRVALKSISLICVDAKIFMRILTTRITPYLLDLIDPHQIGFMAYLEKAYDWVHPDYFYACLTYFGLLPRLINCITSFLFNTSLCVKINDFLSVSFTQGRGLCQGNPLLPLLFNLAVKPLLRTIYASPSIPGFPFQEGSDTRLANSLTQTPVLKNVAYADDIAVFLVNSGQFHALLDILTLYFRVSNACLNRYKTLAASLSGQSALPSHVAHKTLLDPLWHTTHVLFVPRFYLDKARSTIIQFLARKSSPAVSFQICQRSRKEGEISILDPGTQHETLKLRWLQPLFLPSSDPPYYNIFISDILRHCLRLFSVLPFHILPLLFPNIRSSTIKFFDCFNPLFKTTDKIDYKIDWQVFVIHMVNEL